MRSLRLLAAALLATTGLVVVGATTRTADAVSAPPDNSIRATPAKPIAGETTSVYGSLTTAVARQVVLQRQSGDTWKRVASTTSSTSGAFGFTVSTSATRTYRVYAPATRVGSRSYTKLVGPTRKVTIVTQKVTLFVTPDQVCATSPTTTVYAIAQISPVRPGRQVDVAASETAELKTGYADANGRVAIAFTVPAGTTRFRATAAARLGAPSKDSSVYRVELFDLCGIA